MKKLEILLFLSLMFSLAVADSFAQSDRYGVVPSPTPASTLEKNLSEIVSKNLENKTGSETTRERREDAYAKLLEGQKYLWSLRRIRLSGEANPIARSARAALQRAVELDPKLAEAYTALAELSALTSQGDIEEAILLANIAAKLSPDNFGARRLLARLYTVKSGIAETKLDAIFAEKAIGEWKSVARLDARNAEAWAFLSEFYGTTKKPDERLDALQRWLASSAPVDSGFYKRVFGNSHDLSPEAALPKLASALISTAKTEQGIEILCRALIEAPDDRESLRLLDDTLAKNEKLTTSTVLESLQRLVYSNAQNSEIIKLFVTAHRRVGKIEGAVAFLQANIARQSDENKLAASNLYLVLCETLVELGRFSEANAAFESLLALNGIGTEVVNTEDQREVAVIAFERMIALLKGAGKFDEAKSVIKRARVVLGDDDQFADLALISLYRETNSRADALREIRALRSRFGQDSSLLRLEAQVLTELGKVNEGVALFDTQDPKFVGKPDIENAMKRFNDLIFVSSLYTEAKRGKLAIAAARKALAIAQGRDQEMTAQLSLATAAHEARDYKTSEATLRQILKSSPRNPVAMNNLGYFLTERGVALDEALALITDAVKIDPTNPNYLDSLGWVQFKLGNLADAESSLRAALGFDKSSGLTHEHLGDVCIKQGKVETGVAAWNEALSRAWHSVDIARIKAKISSAERKK